MSKDELYHNMKLEIIRISEKALGITLTEEEFWHVMNDRSLIGLESILDYLNDNEFKTTHLEKYLKSL